MKAKISELGTYRVRAHNSVSGWYGDWSNSVKVDSFYYPIKKIKELFPDIFYNGIFQIIYNSTTLLGEWLKQFFALDEMISRDLEYVLKRSGDKSVSVLIKRSIIIKDKIVIYPLEDKYINGIISIINLRYYKKWKALFESLSYDYDPLSPYNMSMKEISKDTMNSQDNKNYNDMGNGKQFTYGYNSANKSPTDEQDATSNGKSEDIYHRDNNIDRDITRKGNIGNTTNQELIRQERELLMYQFWDSVYKDMDDILTQPYYD